MKFISSLVNTIKLYKLMINLNHASLVKYYKTKIVRLVDNIKFLLIIINKYEH